MIEKELEKIVWEERERGSSGDMIRNVLKEYLQVSLLYFVSTSPSYKNLIFTGGTCLRHFYGLERLSVDLDFDYETKPDTHKMLDQIGNFFHKRYRYDDLRGSLKQKENQILLKFPVLRKLGLVRGNESDLLYVKIDLAENVSLSFRSIKTSKNIYGFNFVTRHYDLPDLMAGKLHAVLTRRYLRGKENRQSVKGRDYFDLLWFVKKGVKPNLRRLSDMLSEEVTMAIVERRCDEKVVQFVGRFKGDFQSDVLPLVRNPDLIEDYVDNYQEEYLRWKGQSFSAVIRLRLKCEGCQKIFDTGISVVEEAFEAMELSGNSHRCPDCGTRSVVEKKNYIFI